jgi:hypothetical protein
MRLEFVIVAPPSIEPVAPTKPAVADSCDERQRCGTAPDKTL